MSQLIAGDSYKPTNEAAWPAFGELFDTKPARLYGLGTTFIFWLNDQIYARNLGNDG